MVFEVIIEHHSAIDKNVVQPNSIVFSNDRNGIFLDCDLVQIKDFNRVGD